MSGLEDKVDRLANALERMLDQGRFSGGNTGGTGGDAGGKNTLQTWNTGLTNAISSTGNLVRGQGNLIGVIDDVGKVFSFLGPVSTVLSNVFKGVASEAITMNKNMMDSAKFGINFNQNLGQYAAELGKAGIGQEQWTKLLQTNGKYIAGSAETAQAGAVAFLKASQALMESPDVIRLRLSGIDFSEFQDQLLINTDLLKYNNIQDLTTQRLLRESVVQVTTEIDNMARITGKSRQEVQKSLDQTMQSNVIQIAKMSMDAEELLAYEKSAVTINQYGKGVAELFAELSANRGDTVSKESNEAFAALESFAPLAAQALRQASAETDDVRRAQLVKEFEFRMAQANADKDNMAQFKQFATSQNPVMRQLVNTLVQAQPLMSAGVQAIRYAKEGQTLEGFTAQRDRILEENARQRRATLDGSRPENQTSVAILAAEAGVKTISAGLAMGLEKMINSSNEEIRKLGIDYKKAFEVGAITPAELEKKLKDAIGYRGENTNDRTNAPQGIEFKWNSSNPPLPITGTVRIDPTSPVTRQAFGSKDTFGDWFGGPNNLLSFMNERGPEAVVPKEKIGEFISDMVAQSPGLLNGLQANLRNSIAETNPASAVQRVIEQLTTSFNIPSTVSPSSAGTAINGSIVETKTTSDLLVAIETLNNKMDKLITAVEDGSNANVKAVKSRGNLIA